MTSDRMRTSGVVALALVVGTFFTAEEVFMDLAGRRPQLAGQDVVNGLEFWVVWAFLTPFVLAAARRWPLDGKSVSRPLVAHALVSLALAMLHNLVAFGARAIVLEFQTGASALAATRGVLRTASGTAFVWGVFTGVVFYAVIVLVHAALRFRGLYAAEQVSAAALEAELTQSKLDTLRSQLRPHFLFNTLNAISVFITEDAAKAQQMILRLSSLLRRSLDEEAHEVPLRQELGFVDDYLDIQRGRFGDQLVVNLTIDPAVMDARVPVFLLQPLMENAIEHGKSDERPATIALRGARDHDMLHLTLEDDGIGVGGTIRDGLGLSNTRARLHHLYGSRATVDLRSANGGVGSSGARVDIRIPYQAAPV
jgi:two-component system, LytTR family, sensor kinase